MTRPVADVRAVLDLAAQGMSKKAMSRRTGVSRATIRDWLADPDAAVRRGTLRGGGVDCQGRCLAERDIDEHAYSYLLGMYLGDGYIVRHPGAYRLRVFCDQKYPRIMDQVAEAIRRLLAVRVGRVPKIGCDEITAYSRHWPCLFPQHGPGVKHERPIILDQWQREIVVRHPKQFLRGLIHSDGWRGQNVAVRTTDGRIERRYYPRYQFSNRSEDIRRLFCWACELLTIHWTRSGEWAISVSRRKDVEYMDSFIGPKS